MADEAKVQELVGSSKHGEGDEKKVQPSSKHRSLAGARAATIEVKSAVRRTKRKKERKNERRGTGEERRRDADSEGMTARRRI